MIQKERLELILDELKKHGTLSLKEIVSLTDSSRDTARRDIVKLAQSNAIDRTYGGISLPNTFSRLDEYLERTEDLSVEKNILAKTASSLVKENSHIYLDISTTVSHIPRHIGHLEQVIAVTNSLDISDQLLRNTKCKTKILGGTIDPVKRSTVGTKPMLELDSFTFDIAFISAAGITTSGIFYAYDEDIDFKKKIREQSKIVVLLIDNTKIGLSHNYKGLNFEEIDFLVVESRLPDDLERKITESNVSIINSRWVKA
ncbi:DeoR/GlpR family DNA-binding transcription regulator [Enterococcus raffinosus]|uniref:DeoR/GlpR family DNA-binding transcription regulator n=1 Tax=Enterococcus raffinosus TaxID=71452 RepID=UPI001C0FD083|nr:DeoR/GlpR family DNA-binding transcription regulator [Enterococcus raffinosus]MBU5361706.1 DeoR/GlpR family DNA-binding transcription regulator [Enterococcus raffinosus]